MKIQRIRKTCGFTLVELMVVATIFTFIIGAAFMLLTTGQFSAAISESSVAAEESARTALERLNRDLRLSHPSHVYIYTDLDTEADTSSEPISGSVLYLQIPVGSYDNQLDLNGSSVKWGTNDTEGDFIYYYLGNPSGPYRGRLFRGTCANVGEGVDNSMAGD